MFAAHPKLAAHTICGAEHEHRMEKTKFRAKASWTCSTFACKFSSHSIRVNLAAS